MSLVFINYPLETFTPTSSGALATVIWECCRRAQQENIHPFVITNADAVQRFDWPNTLPISYLEKPATAIGMKLWRAERKLSGWRHLQYRKYATQVMRALQQNSLSQHPLVVLNDPEMAVLLRRRFPHAFILHWFFNQMECRPQFRNQFAQSADVHAAVSNFTGRYVTQYYNLRDRPIETVYIAADVERFQPAQSKPDGKPVINFVGRTGIEKAPDLLLKAALQVAKKSPAFGLQMLGSNHWGYNVLDDYQRQLCEMVEELEHCGVQVHRPGHISRPDLPAELRKAHIHVMPSRWDEPFALATLEGMATGLATVASRTGGTPEAVEGAGLLFERDSVDGLADHLDMLIRHPELCTELGAKARARAEEFTWERTWNRLKHLTGV